MKRAILVILVCGVLAWAAVVNGSLSVLGTLTATIVDFTGASSTAPMKSGTTLPGTCSVGQAFFKTDATAGQNIYLCTASNTWTQVQGGGGGGTFEWKRNTQYISLFSDFSQLSWGVYPPAPAGDFTFYRHQGSTLINHDTGMTFPNITRAGALFVSTTTTSGNISHWTAPLSFNDYDPTHSLYYHTNKPWRMEFVFTIVNVADVDAVVGLMKSDIENPPALFGIGVRSSVGPDFYWVTASSNTWGSALSTGVAADSRVWHKVVLRSDGTANYKFWASLDGGTEVSVCESGCDVTMSSSGSHWWASKFGIFLKTNAAATKIVALDYLSFWMDRGAAR